MTSLTLLRRRTITLDPNITDLPEGIVGSEFAFAYANRTDGRTLRGRITGFLHSDRGTLLLRVLPHTTLAGVRAAYITRDPNRHQWVVCFDGVPLPREHLFDGHPGRLSITCE